MDTLISTINFVQYHNPENGFSILKVIPEGSTFAETMQIKMLDPTPGITIKAEGVCGFGLGRCASNITYRNTRVP